jgi:hypothetical protein
VPDGSSRSARREHGEVERDHRRSRTPAGGGRRRTAPVHADPEARSEQPEARGRTRARAPGGHHTAVQPHTSSAREPGEEGVLGTLPSARAVQLARERTAHGRPGEARSGGVDALRHGTQPVPWPCGAARRWTRTARAMARGASVQPVARPGEHDSSAALMAPTPIPPSVAAMTARGRAMRPRRSGAQIQSPARRSRRPGRMPREARAG